MRASDDLAAFVEEHDPPEMPTVATDGKTVMAIAEVDLTRFDGQGWCVDHAA